MTITCEATSQHDRRSLPIRPLFNCKRPARSFCPACGPYRIELRGAGAIVGYRILTHSREWWDICP